MLFKVFVLLTLSISLISATGPKKGGLLSQDGKDVSVAQFSDWCKKHGKVYPSASEFQRRLSIFQSNRDKVIDLNGKASLGARYTLNKFADLTSSEFTALYTGLRPQLTDDKLQAVEGDAPDSVDWRTKGAVTNVKDQGQCGSCWAFSTIGNVEGQWFLAGNTLVALSEEQLVDCDRASGDEGCNGGLMTNAFGYIISCGGLESEADYPYKAGGGSSGKCKFDKSKVAAKISSFKNLPTDEGQIATWVAANGPASIALNAGKMQFYSGGIDDASDCDPSEIDHGVLLIGYGTEGSTNYWIIKNSWGPDWGENGYYRIVKGKGACGLNTMVSSSQV